MFVDADVPLERLEHEITSMAGQLAATTCPWLQLIAALDRREGGKVWGTRSCAHWLAWKCGVSLRTGREHVRVAHALGALPLTTAAFERGELSYSKVKALTRVATPDSEAELVEFARTATAAQLDRTVQAYESSNRPPGEQHDARYLRRSSDGDVRAQLPPEHLALLDAALEQAMALLPAESGPAGPLSIEQRRADALALIAESFLANQPAARDGDERTMVVLHVDADNVTAPDLDDGTPLHPETAKRLSCDASVVTIIEKDGVPIGVGRMTRQPTRRIRRALKARDRHCQWPGCTSTLFTEGHHRWHWTEGGPTDLDNLVLLCWFHHHQVHEGGFSIDADHRVYRPDGTQVRITAPQTSSPLDVTIPADAIAARWAGEHLDLDLAVTALHCLVGT